MINSGYGASASFTTLMICSPRSSLHPASRAFYHAFTPIASGTVFGGKVTSELRRFGLMCPLVKKA